MSDQTIEIRTVRLDDAPALLDLKLALDSESSFMMFEPGERSTCVQTVVRDIELFEASANSMLMVAADGSQLVGYVEATGGGFRRRQHAATIVAGVRADYAGQGVGSRLLESLVAWSDLAGIVRLELTVMAHNVGAKSLYRKYGFISEGVRQCSMRVDGSCIDEIAMARIKPDFAGATTNEYDQFGSGERGR